MANICDTTEVKMKREKSRSHVLINVLLLETVKKFSVLFTEILVIEHNAYILTY